MSLANGGGENGNGGSDKPPAILPTLELVAERIREKTQEMRDLAPEQEPFDMDDWKVALQSNHEDLKKIHKGLVVISETAEAAVEAMLLVTRDLKSHMAKSAPAIESVQVVREQVATLGSKVATLDHVIDRVDQMVADNNKTIGLVRRDIYDIKVDIAQMKEHVALIPAMKAMLGDVIARLPEDQPEDGINRLESMLGDIIKRLPDPEHPTGVRKKGPRKK